VLDSGAVSRLAERSSATAALIAALRHRGLWPPLVPSVVVVESVTGRPGADAIVNRLLKTCEIVDELHEPLARRAAALRYAARQGSVVDAVVVVIAEPAGTVLTGDVGALTALAAASTGVTVERV
jgi:hypothetical protein